MGNLDKLERETKEMSEAVKTFESAAKKQHLDLEREQLAPVGYWYCHKETNTAFYWFLFGMSYGKAIN